MRYLHKTSKVFNFLSKFYCKYIFAAWYLWQNNAKRIKNAQQFAVRFLFTIYLEFLRAAWAADNLAIGTLNGEHET